MNQDTAPLGAIEPKQHFSGTIRKTTLAGAIVDIGLDVPGVVHISQLQKDPVNKVEDVVHEGQPVDVWVRRVKADRVELTMIKPLSLEWKDIKPELVMKGRVVRLEAYGAFIDIGAERPGMVHVSEMAHNYVKAPGDVVKEGDEVEVMILEVDRHKKQIRLSMKAAMPKPEETPQEAPKAEKKPKAKRGKARETIEEPEQKENDPTVFELAWRDALERQKSKKSDQKASRVKTGKKEQEEILARTLEKRLPTGG